MLQPLAKKLLVKAIESKHGTLILTNQKPSQFEVLAVGDEIIKVKIGDIIFIEKHYGTEIEHDKEKYLVIEESSILAKIV